MTTRPGTTPPMTTRPGTTPPMTTRPGTTPPMTTRPGTTPPMTTRPGTTPPMTTRPGTIQPGTTPQGTTQQMTTRPGTTPPMTTRPGTTPPMTTRPGTTQLGTNLFSPELNNINRIKLTKMLGASIELSKIKIYEGDEDITDKIKTLTASSLWNNDKFKYGPENLIDNDKYTIFHTNSRDEDPYQSIELELDKYYNITQIIIVNRLYSGGITLPPNDRLSNLSLELYNNGNVVSSVVTSATITSNIILFQINQSKINIVTYNTVAEEEEKINEIFMTTSLGTTPQKTTQAGTPIPITSRPGTTLQ
jgi:hypothetical protein